MGAFQIRRVSSCAASKMSRIRWVGAPSRIWRLTVRNWASFTATATPPQYSPSFRNRPATLSLRSWSPPRISSQRVRFSGNVVLLPTDFTGSR